MATQESVSTEVSKEVSTYDLQGIDLASILAEEMDGLIPSFERIKIPAGGSLAYEIPSEDPESPDTVKEFKAVILYHHPIHSYYSEKYTGGNNPPECGSMDGHIGVDAETGEVKNCSDCPFNKFGSGDDKKGKACKQKRRIYLLREGEALPTLLSLPTGSLSEYSKYIMRLLSKGKKTNSVVTKFTLKKAQNSGGISYSQAVFSKDRDLTPDEQKNISRMTDQVKAIAGKVILDSDNIQE
jgi:hypothetical protein